MLVALLVTRSTTPREREEEEHDSSMDLVLEESLPSNLEEIIEAVLEDEELLDIRSEAEVVAENATAGSGLTEQQEADQSSKKKIKEKKLHIPETKKKISKKKREAFEKALENDPLGVKDTPLTRAQWLKLQEYEKEVTKEREDLEKRMDAYTSLLKSGDWYWGKTRNFVRKKSQCFWTTNITANAKEKKYKRSIDFRKPIEGKWVYASEDLPVYWPSNPGTPTDKCFSKRESLRKVLHTRSKNKKKDHFVVFRDYDCDAESKCSKLHFKPSQCEVLRLFDVRVAATLKRRRVFFVGDYSMKQQYENLLCVLSPFLWPMKSLKTLKKGSRTGLTGEGFATWNHETEIHFIYAGFHRLSKKRDVQAEKKGSGSRGGTDAGTLTDDLNEYGIYEIADVLRERQSDFRATDIVVANIGNDYGDETLYKQSLLRFLRVVEDMKAEENAPLVVWRESSAQHHSGHEGGDIFRPHSPHNQLDATPANPVGRTMAEKLGIHCHAIQEQELKEGNWRNDLANRLMASAGIQILRVWKSTASNWKSYRHWCKDSELPEAKGAHCERWGPCKSHCNPGVVTYFNELLLTFIDAPVISKDLRLREKTLNVSSDPNQTIKSYHRVLTEHMVKVFLKTNEVWPFDRKKAQINPKGEDVKWNKLEQTGKKEEKYWEKKQKESLRKSASTSSRKKKT